jgi:hypothetical protein
MLLVAELVNFSRSVFPLNTPSSLLLCLLLHNSPATPSRHNLCRRSLLDFGAPGDGGRPIAIGSSGICREEHVDLCVDSDAQLALLLGDSIGFLGGGSKVLPRQIDG